MNTSHQLHTKLAWMVAISILAIQFFVFADFAFALVKGYSSVYYSVYYTPSGGSPTRSTGSVRYDNGLSIDKYSPAGGGTTGTITTCGGGCYSGATIGSTVTYSATLSAQNGYATWVASGTNQPSSSSSSSSGGSSSGGSYSTPSSSYPTPSGYPTPASGGHWEQVTVCN